MNELKKTISIWEGLALAVSMVIGTGLLGLPGITLDAGNAHSAAGGWILIFLAVIPLVHIFARLGLQFASSAGLSKYAQAGVGDWGGYAVSAVLCGTFVIAIPAMTLIGAAYLQKFLNWPEDSVFLLAIGILVLLTIVNLTGVKVVSLLNSASLVTLVIMLMAIILFNLSFVGSGFKIFFETVAGKGDFSYQDLWRTSALLFWAFLGWENLSFGLEEFKKPEKTIPRVYWLSYLFVLILYLGLAVTSIGADVSGISIKGVAGLTSLVEQTPIGFLLMLIMILIILANDNAWVFGASRLIYASGRDGVLPSFLGRLSKDSIPANSLITLFLCYTVFIVITYLFEISISTIILLVNQNFLVLYAFSIFAYWKTEKGPSRWLFTLLALVSCGFLLSGFSWWIIYPLLLLSIGYAGYRRTKMNSLVRSQ